MKKLGLLIITLFSIPLAAYSQAPDSTVVKLSAVEYQQHYDKLKELFLKQLDYEGYKKMADKSDEFYRKCRTDENRDSVNNYNDEPFSIEKMMLWLEANIEKTDFKDFAQVKAEFKEIEDLRYKVIVDNIEFYDYLAEIDEIEPDMFLTLINDITLNHPGKFRF